MTRAQARPRLLADIGATNARFSLTAGGAMVEPRVVLCVDYRSVEEAIRAFLSEQGAAAPPGEAAFAVAAPVGGDMVAMTNHPWRFSVASLKRSLALERLVVVNDFTAVALALPHLAPAELRQIGPGAAEPRAPKAVLGPGSGLGVSGLVPAGEGWVALGSEGGHVDFAPGSEREIEILGLLRRETDHVSLERLLSGPGLVTLYRAIAALDGVPADEGLAPADVSARAQAGTDATAAAAVRTFSGILGSAAGDLALTLGAKGGVYIGGGVVPRLGAAFDEDIFRRRFEAKGRFVDYLAPIPTYLIERPLPAFVGLMHLLEAPGA